MFLYPCVLIGCHVSVIFLIVQCSRYILWYYSITDLSALFWSHTLELYNLRIIQSAPAVISITLLMSISHHVLILVINHIIMCGKRAAIIHTLHV